MKVFTCKRLVKIYFYKQKKRSDNMRLINNLSLSKELILKLNDNNIKYIEEVWVLKRSELKSRGFTNEEINNIIISLQLIGLDLNKKKY